MSSAGAKTSGVSGTTPTSIFPFLTISSTCASLTGSSVSPGGGAVFAGWPEARLLSDRWLALLPTALPVSP